MSTVTPSAPTLIIVSGLSGSGKSVALKTFEDQDYYCSDNLPINLLPDFVRSLLANHDGSAPRRLAVGIDVRGQADLSQLGDWRQLAADAGVDVKVLFFEASDETLLKRYADTRRRHPLSQLGLSLPEAIARERELTAPLRREADAVIDTSSLNVHQLRRRIITEFTMDHATGLSRCLNRSPTSAACRPRRTSCSMRGCCPIRTGTRTCARSAVANRVYATTWKRSRTCSATWPS